MGRTAALTAEIAQRKEYEARAVRLNRLYSVLSGINTAIVRVREIQELFNEACRIAVVHGGFAFAWIGMLEGNTRVITPVAKMGQGNDELFQLNLSLMSAPEGAPLVEDLITHFKPFICNDLIADKRMEGLHNAALAHDYLSMAILPLVLDGQLVGIADSLYSRDRVFRRGGNCFASRNGRRYFICNGSPEKRGAHQLSGFLRRCDRAPEPGVISGPG